jgi:hypothetical protein
MPDSAGQEPSQASSPHREEKIDSTLALAIGIISAISGFVSLLITIQNFLNGSHVRQSFGAGLATVVLVAGASFFLTVSIHLWDESVGQRSSAMGGIHGLPVMTSRSASNADMPCLTALET